MAATAERISAEEAHELLDSDSAVLVCAYDDDEKCRKYRLEGSITLNEFKSRERTLPRDREVIFYCA